MNPTNTLTKIRCSPTINQGAVLSSSTLTALLEATGYPKLAYLAQCLLNASVMMFADDNNNNNNNINNNSNNININININYNNNDNDNYNDNNNSNLIFI